MRIGIHYDTGFFPAGRSSREVFDPEQVAFDMNAVAHDLHCDAVRVSGGDLGRLSVAAEFAAAAGLEVWFSPMPCELDTNQMLAFFGEGADRAAALRRISTREVVLVLGCEVSVFGRGFLPGADAYARLRELSAPSPELFAEYPALVARLNAFLSDAADRARSTFAGPVTYAAGLWEDVDWTPFDVVGVDAYRDQSNAATFGDLLDARFAYGKPVAVTEFGCCTYRGAAARGASGWSIVEDHDGQRRLDGVYVRDEIEQVRYLHELYDVYQRHGVDIAFWFTFASWDRPHRPDPREDLDMASFGVVKVADAPAGPPERRWSPKAVFYELATIARRSAAGPR